MLIGATAILFLLPLVGIVTEVWQFLIVLGSSTRPTSSPTWR